MGARLEHRGEGPQLLQGGQGCPPMQPPIPFVSLAHPLGEKFLGVYTPCTKKEARWGLQCRDRGCSSIPRATYGATCPCGSTDEPVPPGTGGERWPVCGRAAPGLTAGAWLVTGVTARGCSWCRAARLEISPSFPEVWRNMGVNHTRGGIPPVGKRGGESPHG